MRPDAAELAALWADAVVVDSAAWEGPQDADPPCWLQSRGLDVDAVAAADLARAIPDGLTLPSWAMYGARSWAAAGFRLVVQAGGPDGREGAELVGISAPETDDLRRGEPT
ncbi:MAG: hypothetical protein ABIK09_13975 [Pseudomonadota bacterium]